MNKPQNIKTPLPLDWLVATGQEVTEEKMQAAEQAQRYEHRETIPETYLWMADLYNELTGQEPTKRVLLDWLQTFEEWKQEGLQVEHLRSAWQQANDINKGFHVGRPGALTVVAVSIKSKTLKPTGLAVNTQRIEETKKELYDNSHWSNIVVNQDARQKAREEFLKRRVQKKSEPK